MGPGGRALVSGLVAYFWLRKKRHALHRLPDPQSFAKADGGLIAEVGVAFEGLQAASDAGAAGAGERNSFMLVGNAQNEADQIKAKTDDAIAELRRTRVDDRRSPGG